MKRVRKSIKISGIIASRSFIDHLYSLAQKFTLSGWIKSTGESINMEIEGDNFAVLDFLSAIQGDQKSVSKIAEVDCHDISVLNSSKFYIIEEKTEYNSADSMPQDFAACNDCMEKLIDSSSRKYKYPFIACEKCGPKYSIINSLPFSRENSTLYDFEHCYECQESINNTELESDFSNCSLCGPKIWLKEKGKVYFNQEESFKSSAKIINSGGILLLKSTNCFYLCSSAFIEAPIQMIREIKARKNKPLTVMAKNIEAVEKFAYISETEKQFLTSKERPVVTLRLKNPDYLAPNIVYGFDKIGVMLPVNPIHHLLFDTGDFDVLLMSSANKNGRTIEIDNFQAEESFGEVVDGILFHDLTIKNGSDDSIITVVNNEKYVFRLARGYTPNSISLADKQDCPVILACGAHQSSTIAITTPDGKIHVSPYLGDLDTSKVFDLYKKNVIVFCKLFNVTPEHAVCDLNPDYLSTKYVKTLKLPYSQVQHDYAHLISCLVDNNIAINTPTIGVIFDGSGYGSDQTVWGGEFLVSRDLNYERVAHIPAFKMVGISGKESQIYRLGYSILQNAGIEANHPAYKNLNLTEEEKNIFASLMNKGVNSPLTSSAGKLFDAVASILGIMRNSYYEEYSTLYLESLTAKNCLEKYELDNFHIKNLTGLIRSIANDIEAKEPTPKILARFHNTLASMITCTCLEISKKTGIKQVALSGSVWMNILLLERTFAELKLAGLNPLIHKNISTNDEGLSVGQAAYLAYKLNKDKSSKKHADKQDSKSIFSSDVYKSTSF